MARRKGRATILSLGTVPMIGPRPGPFDDLSYDELLKERRYFFAELEKYEKILDLVMDTDPRGAVWPESKEVEDRLGEFCRGCETIIEVVEKRMIELTKEKK